MPRRRVPKRGDVFWIDPNPTIGHEMRDRHRFVVVSPEAINRLGLCITVPVTTGGERARASGMVVAVTGSDTNGVAVCHQVRAFDIEARIANRTARYIERIDAAIADEIAARVASIVDPAEE